MSSSYYNNLNRFYGNRRNLEQKTRDKAYYDNIQRNYISGEVQQKENIQDNMNQIMIRDEVIIPQKVQEQETNPLP